MTMLPERQAGWLPQLFVPPITRASAVAALLILGTLSMPTAAAQITGIVTDLSGTPIGEALVSIRASKIRTLTGADGRFELTGIEDGRVVVVAGRQGFYNGSLWLDAPTTGITIELEAIPQDDNPDYQFVRARICGGCHNNQFEDWTGSAMAQAGTNTWVYDIYDGSGTEGGNGGFVYVRDSVYGHENPASECAACHQPEAWAHKPYQPLDPLASLSTPALHGVSCDLCHKIAYVDESKANYPGLYPGSVTLTRPAEASSQVQYGGLGDTEFGLDDNIMRPSYQPQLTAAMCGVCHQDMNDPDEDGDFADEEGVISEPTYLEWLASPYGDPESPLYTTCVDCHMPPSGADTIGGWYGYRFPVRDSLTIRSHRIEGTTARYLENALTLQMESRIGDRQLHVDIRIINDQAGHHVPDGVTVRNMVLLVEAKGRRNGQPLTQLRGPVVDDLGGVGDPAQGYFAGLPGILFAKVNHDASGRGPTFFTDATGIQWDNRIAALGVDESSYAFDLPVEGAGVDVRARLIYRRAFRFLVDAKGWTEDGHGRPLEDIQPPHFGHLMEEAVWSWSGATAVSGDEADVPNQVSLEQNYPNPFNPSTTIRYETHASGRVVLEVHNLLGETVRRLVDEDQAAGRHGLGWDGRDDAGRQLAAGTYLYRLQAPGGVQLRKMLLVH
ncbi:MAG: T9SS type A sorting domain-containing protein [Gemmatimonadetes bacterium]|nr:T9SS type A sorting domain-containing protein [Gemmatimonadota bacterium]